MPTDIQKLFELDYKSLAASVVILMVGWIALKTILEKFLSAFGVEFSWLRKRKELEERVNKLCSLSDEHTEELKDLKQTVKDLSDKISKSERARLKDRILQAYRQYKEKGEWSEMEREAMLGLIESYRENGEHNTYVNDIIAVDIENFKIID